MTGSGVIPSRVAPRAMDLLETPAGCCCIRPDGCLPAADNPPAAASDGAMGKGRVTRAWETVPAWRAGRAHGPAASLAREDRGIWCWICGRPLGQGEDIGPWRLRTARPSPRWQHELRPVCPAHYEPADGRTVNWQAPEAEGA
jgi:hypothetical protein